MPGKIPAHITAKIVIASAALLIDVLHFCLNRNSTAEIRVPACPLPIQNPKSPLAQPHAIGWFKPHTPTPVEIKYPIMAKHMSINGRLQAIITHHHLGVLPSMIPAIWSEIQARDRLFRTNGSRSISRGGGAISTE
jgi:hypothetical protein